MSKYRVFSGTSTGKHGPEKTPYLDTFHAVRTVTLATSKELKLSQ